MHADQLFSACAKTPPLETSRTTTTSIACTHDIRHRTILYYCYLVGGLLAYSIMLLISIECIFTFQFMYGGSTRYSLLLFLKKNSILCKSFCGFFNEIEMCASRRVQLQQVLKLQHFANFFESSKITCLVLMFQVKCKLLQIIYLPTYYIGWAVIFLLSKQYSMKH